MKIHHSVSESWMPGCWGVTLTWSVPPGLPGDCGRVAEQAGGAWIEMVGPPNQERNRVFFDEESSATAFVDKIMSQSIKPTVEV